MKSKPGAPAYDDLVGRRFTAPAPNLLWLADITGHRTDAGTLYACAIKDMFPNRIVGHALGSRMKARRVDAALEVAVAAAVTSPDASCTGTAEYPAPRKAEESVIWCGVSRRR